MNSKLIHEHGGQRTFAIIFDTGDEPVAGLESFAREQRLAASQFTAIGAFRDATLAYFDWETKKYNEIPVREQVEVLTLAGDVSVQQKDGKPKVHVHVVIGKRDGTAHGGHLLRATVRPTLEVVLTESPAHLRRTVHDDSGLALIDLSRSDSA
jgi:predicted DNA-binding protein with PD1-like motif